MSKPLRDIELTRQPDPVPWVRLFTASSRTEPGTEHIVRVDLRTRYVTCSCRGFGYTHGPAAIRNRAYPVTVERHEFHCPHIREVLVDLESYGEVPLQMAETKETVSV